jgi:aromatase
MSIATSQDGIVSEPGTQATVGHTDNSIVIGADIDVVWRLTNDLQSWPDLFTEYASVDILDHTDNTYRFRLSMHPDENGTVWSWVSERTLDPVARRVVARRVEPGPFEFMNIEWTYETVPEGTLMRWVQDFRMRPQAPVDTPTMTVRINNNSKIQMAIIARKVEAAAGVDSPSAISGQPSSPES